MPGYANFSLILTFSQREKGLKKAASLCTKSSYESNYKKKWDVSDNRQLRSDGGNLAAVLYRLEQEDVRTYEDICRQIGRVLPGFDRFAIEEEYGKVLLRWKAKWADKTFGAHVTSDGSLRAFALVTLLRMPANMLPDVILLDEPELGLHTSAVGLIGNMIASRSHERQIIVATQSPQLGGHLQHRPDFRDGPEGRPDDVPET